MSLWLSSGAFKTRNLAEMLAIAHRHNIKNIELSSGLAHHSDVSAILQEEDNQGDINFLVHNYFPAPEIPFVLNIASLDSEGLEQTREFGKQSLKLASKLNSPFYSIHAGFAAALRPEHLGQPGRLASTLTAADIDRDAAYEVMINTTRHLADYAAQLNLELLIENNVISPVFLERMPINPLLLTEASEIIQFFKDVDRPNVGLLLDVAHARVSATAQDWSAEEFVERVADHVYCLHLSDNNGREDSNQAISDSSWFLPFLKNFNNKHIVIEVYNLEPEQMQQQLALVRESLA